MKKYLLPILSLSLVAISCADDLAQTYEKAFFLEKGKGKTNEAVTLYRKIATAEVNAENRSVVVKSLKRLLAIYQQDETPKAKLDEYLSTLNLDFQQGKSGPKKSMPKFWGGGGKGYLLTAEKLGDDEGWCGKVSSTTGAGGFGTLTSSLKASLFRGKKVELSGRMKFESVDGFVGLWLRSDVGKKMATFYNMSDRELKGTQDWQRYQFEIEIPEEVTNINFGALMAGQGTMWVDDLQIKIISGK